MQSFWSILWGVIRSRLLEALMSRHARTLLLELLDQRAELEAVVLLDQEREALDGLGVHTLDFLGCRAIAERAREPWEERGRHALGRVELAVRGRAFLAREDAERDGPLQARRELQRV